MITKNNYLNQLFPDFTTTDSLFQPMVSLGAPWTTAIAKSMDIAYFTMYSGIKNPTIFAKLQKESGDIPEILWDIFGKNWQKLWDAYLLKYNPIDNYNVQESVSRNQTDDRTIDKSGTSSSQVDGTNSENVTENGTNSLEHGQIIDTENNVSSYTYGFNSTEKVPTAEQDEVGKQTNSGTDTTTIQDKTDTTGTTSETAKGTTSENTTDNNTISETITRTRSGNVGQNSYQDLLLKEFELWKWNFFTQVFDDCDKYLCIPISNFCAMDIVN